MGGQTIITGCGVYVTRSGRLAFISDVDGGADGGEQRYFGYVLHQDRHAAVQQWYAWSADGHCQSLINDHIDIIEKV
ncbi:hypothetical protein [Parapusillimonas granuli]|uniref:Uncharacterized protein n=1 Tax=Parapusillimonas granuli TaxID=380911 RepID=A0A853G1R6_9BURK|nr:hypothetical protein [Parapusillimonas granuli]MBB5217007.1 hypothetical protein [Parapusillimonas granuli]MEB2400663.1 hypothetical protein [Alcaligenaceae bacterium]NYT50229.1 hypothetical protein [Parapusillimonas granuli]